MLQISISKVSLADVKHVAMPMSLCVQIRLGCSKDVLYILVLQGASNLPAIKFCVAPEIGSLCKKILDLGSGKTLTADSFEAPRHKIVYYIFWINQSFFYVDTEAKGHSSMLNIYQANFKSAYL